MREVGVLEILVRSDFLSFLGMWNVTNILRFHHFISTSSSYLFYDYQLWIQIGQSLATIQLVLT